MTGYNKASITASPLDQVETKLKETKKIGGIKSGGIKRNTVPIIPTTIVSNSSIWNPALRVNYINL